MPQKPVIKNRTIHPDCKFDCEMLVGPDVTLEEQEICRIYDEAIAVKIDGKYQWLSLADFKNSSGQTIGEFLLDNNTDFAVALSKKE